MSCTAYCVQIHNFSWHSSTGKEQKHTHTEATISETSPQRVALSSLHRFRLYFISLFSCPLHFSSMFNAGITSGIALYHTATDKEVT